MTAVLEDMLCGFGRVCVIFLARGCVVLCRGGSRDSSWLVTGVLIFLGAKSENLRHAPGSLSASRTVKGNCIA